MRPWGWLWVGGALAACGGAPASPPVDARAYADQTPVNPTTEDGKLVYRSFGDHHPDCFHFVGDDGADTKTIACPEGAIHQLESCPAGKLYAPSGEPCVCLPLDGEASEVACPH